MKDITLEQYAQKLGALVLEHAALEPARYGGIASWEDLHSVCDANEFVIDVDNALGIDYPADLDTPEGQKYCTTVNNAIDMVVAKHFPL